MVSPTHTMKEKSLSYYFNLHNEEFSSPCSSKSSSNRLDHFFASSLDATRHAHTKHNKPSSSGQGQGQWKPLLEGSENAKPLSWLSALFSRRKKKQKARSAKIDNGSSSSPSLHWEAPRASSWEQLSSWEKPTSCTWELPTEEEPHRASEAGIEELEAAIAKQNQLMMMKKESPKEEGQHQRKKWIRSVLAIKWAMKLKRRLMKKKREGEAEDEEDKASTASSSARGSTYSYHSLQNGQQIKGGLCHSQRELGSSYYSSLHSNYTTSHLTSRHLHRKGDIGESGLLRFYLTPSRNIKLASKRQQRSHHPLILGL